MVKTPQGTLGYFVNGVLVHRPKHQPSRTAISEKVVYKHKRLFTKQELEFREKLVRENNVKARRYAAEIFVILKNHSKSGVLIDVMHTLSKEHSKQRGGPRAYNTFSDLVELLFMPDYEERRSCIYYACLTGRTTLVKIYLSLRVVARLSDTYGRFMMSEMNFIARGKQRKNTFRGWLKLMDFSAPGMLFHAKDFDLCVLNSLSDEIREMMTQKKYSIIDVFKMISSTPGWTVCGDNDWKNEIRVLEEIVRRDLDSERVRIKMKNNGTKKATKKPMLNTEDEWYDYDYDSDYDESEFEYASNDEKYCEDKQQDDGVVEEREATDPLEPSNQEVEQADSVPFLEWEEEDEEEVCTVADDMSELDGRSLADTTAASWSHFGNEDTASEDWSVLDASKSEFRNNDWDVVSEAPSVDTFSTLATSSSNCGVFSYKAALLKSSSSDNNTSGQTTTTKVGTNMKNVRKPLNPIHENEEKEMKCDHDKDADLGDMLEDPAFDHDMRKGGRGGKKGLMFKGNQRTPASVPRRYRSYY